VTLYSGCQAYDWRATAVMDSDHKWITYKAIVGDTIDPLGVVKVSKRLFWMEEG